MSYFNGERIDEPNADDFKRQKEQLAYTHTQLKSLINQATESLEKQNSALQDEVTRLRICHEDILDVARTCECDIVNDVVERCIHCIATSALSKSGVEEEWTAQDVLDNFQCHCGRKHIPNCPKAVVEGEGK